jgi:hypothetical protein
VTSLHIRHSSGAKPEFLIGGLGLTLTLCVMSDFKKLYYKNHVVKYDCKMTPLTTAFIQMYLQAA